MSQETQENSTPTQFKNWRWEQDENQLAWLYVDKADASTNVLSKDVLEELDQALTDIQKVSPKGLIILSAKKNGFIAGANIKEFTEIKNQDEATALIQRGQRILDKIEGLPFPSVALIHGFCLGGGYELALACTYRVADSDAKTKIGLPEVKLGIHPGFGGTVRLPPIVGAPAAMDMMLSGRVLSARAAKKIGAVDWAVPERQLKDAAAAILQKAPAPTRAKGWKALTNNMMGQYLRMPVRVKWCGKSAPRGWQHSVAMVNPTWSKTK